ncbi:MAG: hypothetical protein J6K39_02020 [Clostridia bacterium]|nr:hypothetical protein [Clostridia bacterium]
MEEKENIVVEGQEESKVVPVAEETSGTETTENIEKDVTEVTEVVAEESAVEEETTTEEKAEKTAVEEKPEEVKAKKEKPKKQPKAPKEKKIKEKKKKEKTVEVDSDEGLSDDELYAKIQTEKLLKRKKTKRIATFAGLCFAFALAVCIIVLAVVPVSLKPNCLQDGFVRVYLHPGTTSSVSISEDDDKYDDFMRVYDKAFAQTYLNALFSGSLFSYDIQESVDSYSDENAILGSFGSLVGTDTYFVRLEYSEKQTVTKQNGQAYISRYSNSSWDGKLTFNEAFVVVNKTAGVQDTKIYISAERPSKNETKYTFLTITVKADTSAIYDAWSELTTTEA